MSISILDKRILFQSIQQKFVANKAVLITLFTRYSLYSVAIVESFFLPKLVSNYSYSQFEYYKNLIFIFPIFLLGSYGGFTYLKYVHRVDYYNQLFQIGLLLSIALSVIGSIFLQNFYLLIPFLVFNIYTIAEQRLKVDRKFFEVFAFKPILSVCSILFAIVFYYLYPDSYDHNWALLFTFSVSFILWVAVFDISKIAFPFNFVLKKFKLLRYTLMVKVILTNILASFVFSLIIFFERYFVKEYYSDYLPTYSFAFNLSQIIAVLLSAVSYITSVELGERILSINKEKLVSNFKKACYSFIILFILFMIFVYAIHFYYPKFENLQTITFIISYSKGFFFLVSTVSHLAVYHNYNTKMFLFILKLSILNILLVYILIYFKTNIFTLLAIDSVFVVIYSVYILNIVFNKISYSTNKV